MRLKVSSGKWQPSYLGLNVLKSLFVQLTTHVSPGWFSYFLLPPRWILGPRYWFLTTTIGIQLTHRQEVISLANNQIELQVQKILFTDGRLCGEIRRCTVRYKMLCFFVDSPDFLQTSSNINRILVGNKIADHSHMVVASPGIFILDLTPGLNGLGRDNYKTRREIFKC